MLQRASRPRQEEGMKIGDVSRRRRLSDPVRMRWYAYHRAVRFARRMLGVDGPCPAAPLRCAVKPVLVGV